jgi:predicted O-linked N-acetylglucosamine transferase (SPINDLY family)
MLMQLARKLLASRRASALLAEAWRCFEAGALEDADRACWVAARGDAGQTPEAHRLHVALARVFVEQQRYDLAAPHLERALAGLPPGDPGRVPLQLQLAVSIGAQQTERARDLMAAVVSPADICGRLRRALMLPAILQSQEEIEAVRRRFEGELDALLAERFDPVADPDLRVGSTAFHLAYHARNNAPLLAKLGRLCRRLYPGGEAPRRQRAAGRLRIGFVSTFFHRHSVGRTTLGLVRDLPRERFETFVFAIEPQDDAVAAAFRQHAQHYAALPAELPRVREAIAAAGLDVLLFADIGMHPLTYFLAFSRLAPIQLVTWGHSVTSGIDTLDYYVSAESVETPQSEAYYTEKLLRLPGSFMPRYERAVLPARRSRAELGLPADAHIYYCPQSPFKLHPDFDGVLRAVLERDPRAGILLLDGRPRSAPRLRERFVRSLGPLAPRVHFLERLPPEDFLQYLAAADVILDPLYFGGCNSSCEVFALGQPMLTLPGPQLPGRFTMALYREMEIADCIAGDAGEYADIAVRLACEPDFRADITRRIAERSGRLFDRPDAGVNFGRELLRLVEEGR